MRPGVPHLVVSGKGEKTRYLPLHPGTNALIHDYLEAAGHSGDENGPLFRPIRNNRTGRVDKALDPDMIYKLVQKNIPRSAASKLGRMHYAQRLPPTRSITRPTSPKCRNGSATSISPPPASTITVRPGRRTARRSRWSIEARRKASEIPSCSSARQAPCTPEPRAVSRQLCSGVSSLLSRAPVGQSL
jgi:hypothetical protein